jgi:hypothetical protein
VQGDLNIDLEIETLVEALFTDDGNDGIGGALQRELDARFVGGNIHSSFLVLVENNDDESIGFCFSIASLWF